MVGYPIPGQDGGYPHPRSGWRYPGVLPLSAGWGKTVLTWEPLPRSRWEVPHPRSLSYLAPSAGWVHPPPLPGQDGVGYPKLEQHGVYLLRGGRYASCVHAGGLSCSLLGCKICIPFKCKYKHTLVDWTFHFHIGFEKRNKLFRGSDVQVQGVNLCPIVNIDST